MSAPLGAHEERNLEMVLRVGAGQRQEDPRAAAEWLTDWLNNGLLALNAFRAISTCRAWAQRTSNACCSPEIAPRSPWTSGPSCPSKHSQ